MVWGVCIKQERLLHIRFLALVARAVGMRAVAAVFADVAGALGVLACFFGFGVSARHGVNGNYNFF